MGKKEREWKTIRFKFSCFRYICGAKGLVTMEKEWSPMPISYPYQLTVKVIIQIRVR